MKKEFSAGAEEKIQKGWNFVFQKLYYPKTHMIYDVVFREFIEDAIDIFPTSEEISRSIPNPCGWGTGMEDSTLSLCTMLEAIVNRYKATGDGEMKKYFDMICEGLIINGTVAPEKGFIARCVSPADGKSIYMDSSRDQYTHWIYAGHIILECPLADEAQKQIIRQVLVDIARKAERDVKEENGGYMLRLDGGRGFVSRMLSPELGPHELHRLPMMYAAAYEASGDIHWLDKYHEIREELLTRAEKEFTVDWCYGIAESFGYVYGTYQAQYSFRVLYDIENDEVYKKRYLNLMNIAVQGSVVYIDRSYEKRESYNRERPFYTPWRKCMAKLNGVLDGYAYYVPDPVYGDKTAAEEVEVQKHLRNAGETLIIMNLCPDYTVSDAVKEKISEIIEAANFDDMKSYWPIAFCGAWWGMKAGHHKALN